MTWTPTKRSRLRTAAGVATVLVVSALASAPTADAGDRGQDHPSPFVRTLSSPPKATSEGSSFRVKGEVKNSGRHTLKPGTKVKVQVSNHSTTAVVGRLRLSRFKPLEKKRFSLRAQLPDGLTSSHGGRFSLFACVHARGESGSTICHKAVGTMTVTERKPPGPEFTPGSRSLGDPYFPQIGNGGYDVRHYAIALDYDPATNLFARGTSTSITLRATQNLSRFSFDFQRDLAVSAVTVDGAPAASFSQVDATPEFAPDVPDATQPAKLVVTPPHGITTGSVATVEVDYSGTPAPIQDADESFEGWVRSCRLAGFTPPCDGAYTVNEPIGVQSWFPSNNVPSDKATIETATTVPTTHVALGTGELERRTDNGDGTWTWRWDEDDPTAPFLATATVGLFDYSNASAMIETQTGRHLPIYQAIDSSKNATAKNNFATYTAAIPDVMNYLADSYGPYPFDSTGAVADIAPDVGYALENQTKPHYASSFTSNGVGFNAATQVHELSHQWFGDAVSPASWGQIWFSEGWATFTENAYDPGPPSGEDTANLQDFYDSVYATPDDPAAGDDAWTLPPAELGGAESGPQNLFDGFSVYDRPGAMLIGFRFIVGSDAFYDFARNLQDTYRYDTITEAQFVRAAESASGFTGTDLTRLDDYFQQWLHSTSKPTITPNDF